MENSFKIPLKNTVAADAERERERERERVERAAKFFNFQNLYKAYLDCRRHKRKTQNAAKFEVNFESELLTLEQELQNHTYQIGRSICFVVQEPSLREIFAATFRDRVVHHLLYNFLEPVFEPKFIHSSYASRKNKGIHSSVADLQKHLRKITRNHRRKAYFLHLDIQGFFMSLQKGILFRIISKQVKHPELLWLAELIIFNDPVKNFSSKGDKSLFAQIPYHKSLFHVPQNQGLPIGNLTSQFFANIYLNELDQFAKHQLKARHYLRYVDDFLLLSLDKTQLEQWRGKITCFLKERLGLDIHPHKQILQATDKGIDWLGYIVKPNCVLIRRRIVQILKRKLFGFNKLLAAFPNAAVKQGQLPLPFPQDDPPVETIEKILATVNSYFGLLKHADTYRLRKQLWDNHFGLLQNYLEPADSDFSFIKRKIG